MKSRRNNGEYYSAEVTFTNGIAEHGRVQRWADTFNGSDDNTVYKTNNKKMITLCSSMNYVLLNIIKLLYSV